MCRRGGTGRPRCLIVAVHDTHSHSGDAGFISTCLTLCSRLSAAVFAMDLEGHGRSGGTHGFLPDIDAAAYDVLTVMAAAKRMMHSIMNENASSAGTIVYESPGAHVGIPTFIMGTGGLGSLVALTARRLLVTNTATKTVTNTSALAGVIVRDPPLALTGGRERAGARNFFSPSVGTIGMRSSAVGESMRSSQKGDDRPPMSALRMPSSLGRGHVSRWMESESVRWALLRYVPKVPLFDSIVPRTPSSFGKVSRRGDPRRSFELSVRARRGDTYDPLRYYGAVRAGTAAAATHAAEYLSGALLEEAGSLPPTSATSQNGGTHEQQRRHRRPVRLMVQLGGEGSLPGFESMLSDASGGGSSGSTSLDVDPELDGGPRSFRDGALITVRRYADEPVSTMDDSCCVWIERTIVQSQPS